MEYTIRKLMEHFWAIDQGGVRCFLLVGPDNAVLVDTGFGGDIKSLCDTLTDSPITLITTHSDPDHTGCDHQFPDHYLHPADFDYHRIRNGRPAAAKPLWEGDVFTAGEYRLEVILIPGHTPGSIALLDRKHRFLLSGDTVQNYCIYMFNDGRNLPAFRHSIAKLDSLRQSGAFDTVYASHGDVSLPADILPEHLALADELLGGNAAPVADAPETLPENVKVFQHGRVRMYYPV